MGTVYPVKPLKFRSIWISDIHLGSRACKADYLLDFLHSVQTEHLYLVGDIIDIHAMHRSVYWPQNHNNVIRSILGKAKHDTRVIYIPGNHDKLVRPHTGQIFGNLDIRRTAIHETLQGKKLLILHGDEFDGMLQCPKLMNWIGCTSYKLLLGLNNVYSMILRRFGKPYWSLSSFVKGKFENANKHVNAFENAVSAYAEKRQMDGVICGHIHLPAMKQVKDVLYCNDGDWVEHCSALVERLDGTLSLIHWTDQQYIYGEQGTTLADIGTPAATGIAAAST